MSLNFRDRSTIHKSASPRLIEVLTDSTLELKYKLPELLQERKMTQQELSELSGIRPQTIGKYYKSEPLPGGKSLVNLGHIFALMEVLRISDINELIEVKMNEEVAKRYRLEKYRWVGSGVNPHK